MQYMSAHYPFTWLGELIALGGLGAHPSLQIAATIRDLTSYGADLITRCAFLVFILVHTHNESLQLVSELP